MADAAPASTWARDFRVRQHPDSSLTSRVPPLASLTLSFTTESKKKMKTLTTTVIALAMVALLAPETVSAQSGLTVPESSIATMVVDRAPTGTGMTFPANVERLYAWTRIQGAAAGTTVHHVWIQGDVERADIELRIGGSPWRTWSNKAIMPEWTGDWRVEVRDDRGNVLETIRFTVRG